MPKAEAFCDGLAFMIFYFPEGLENANEVSIFLTVGNQTRCYNGKNFRGLSN